MSAVENGQIAMNAGNTGLPGTIAVRVRAFAALREALAWDDRTMDLRVGTDVAGLLARLATAYPDANLPERHFTVAVNHSFAAPERVLAEGDEVALIPPVSGGATKLFEVIDRPISMDEVASRVSAPDRGGITLFAGTVRGITDAPTGSGTTGESLAGGVVTDYLEYEAYAEMAELKLAEIGAEVRLRWPSVSAISIVHRVGRLEVGDTAVVIAVAASHRRETFDACHYAIDRVKQIAPIWKREVGPDGASWVEGPESLA
jgi:molybdopterin converting factor subunit 1